MGFERRRSLHKRGSILSRQRRLLQATQNRLNNLLWKVMKARIQKRENADFFDELMTRSLAHMITRGLPIQPLGTGGPATTTTMSSVNAEWEIEESLCLDLSGRDRVCCNTAAYCFNGLHNGVINVQDSKNDFSLMSACRQVKDELKKDQFCVRKSLSPCQGLGRGLLESRFRNRVDTLYDQFYKHCRINTTTISGTPAPKPVTQSSTLNNAGVTSSPGRIPVHNGANGSLPGHTHDHHSPTSGSGAILAGALTGGIVLALVLVVAVVFWCKNRVDRKASVSSDSRRMFFQKRQNMHSTEKPRHNNNNRPVSREDSCEYAEIDDCMISPHIVPVNAGYIHPIGDEEGMIQSVSGHSPHPSRSASVPMVTTRGQLSYGPILAANNNSRSTKPAFYHSTSVASPRELNSLNIGSISETILHPQNLPLSDIAEMRESVVEGEFQHSELEEYEEPVSTSSMTSLRYTQLDTADLPPQDIAPEVPKQSSSQPSTPRNSRVKVLPSIPSSPSLRSLSVPNTPPIAKPRRKTANKAVHPVVSDIKRDSVEAEGKKPVDDVTNRDSVMSAKSIHHYFVLEPNEQSEYENSISPSKYV